MRLVDVGPEDEAGLAGLLPVLQELRPHLTPESFRSIYAAGYPQGLRFTAAYDDAGSCVGVAGWRIIELTAHAPRKLYVDDLVTTDTARSSGVGHALLEYLEAAARAAGCSALDLDSAVHRFDAHRFYLRERMFISAHHFTKTLE